MSIRVEDISYIYGKGSPFEKTALSHVDLTINKGEFIGVIGHTGSGKSTLIQHLNGLIHPTSGKVTRFVDLSGLKAEAGAWGYDDVLNGIAWDEKGKRLFVTGKNWPKLFEIKLTGCPV